MRSPRCTGTDFATHTLADKHDPSLSSRRRRDLSRLANELLLACHSARLAVAIRTQVAMFMKELRECFEFVVLGEGE